MRGISNIYVILFLSFFACGALSKNSNLTEKELEKRRRLMVEYQIKARGVKDKRVLSAMLKVKRHKFVPEYLWDQAYNDYPLPIGEGQTISQPYIVALMTELLKLKGDEKVLEIGTGSGYQAAILAELCKKVYTIEIIPSLAESAKKRLKKLGYTNVYVFCGDGYLGLKEYAPFDGIIVTCAPPYVPKPLIEQLKEGGRMVIPVGETYQELKVLIKKKGKIIEKSIIPVRFVPMTGEYVKGEIKLPKPDYRGKMSVEEAIYRRRSIREYSKEPLNLKDISQLLWAAAGITVDGITGASRSFPSAGGLYPLDIYLVALNVKNLENGLYKYIPEQNKLKLVFAEDLRDRLYEASYYQDMFRTASAVIVYAYDYDRIEQRYGKRGVIRYSHMDIGHSAENVYLQAEALGIGTVAVGAFNDKKMEQILKIKDKTILYLLPVGKKK